MPIEESLVAMAQPLPDSSGVAASLNVVKQSDLARGILRRGFLNPSMSVQPLLLPKVSNASSSSLVAKEVGVEGIPIVVCDHGDEIWNGEDGESPFPLGILHLDMPLDWAMDGVHGEVPSLAILDAIEEEFHRKKMIAHQKTKGRRELLNLKSSINYGDASTPSRHWKGKAHMT
jgi:hypothetical protein